MSALSTNTIRTIKTMLQLYAGLSNKMLVPPALAYVNYVMCIGGFAH